MSLSIEESLLGVDRPLEIIGPERWEVYRRLQSLQIPCQCSTTEPLQVSIATPSDLIQVWSVLHQNYSSRPSLVRWLETCWRSTPENN